MNEQALQRYADFFENMTLQSINNLDGIYAADVHFKDPFNDVRGTEEVRRIFRRMFESCKDPRFKVFDVMPTDKASYLHWHMTFVPRARMLGKHRWHIDGISRVKFTADGKVQEHVDYWDASEYFYARLPVVGGLIRLLRTLAA